MANINISSNMNLPVPVVGTDPGPQYATDINSCLTLVDSHNHTTGYGVQIPTSGININSDLSFSSFNATALRTTRYVSQSSSLALATDLSCLYVVSGDLYYNNGAGTAVQVTSGGSINLSGVGGITGLGGTSAAVTYNSITTVFTFTQAANQVAPLATGPITIAPVTTSAPGITVQAPSSLSSAYTLTLPGALAAGAGSLLISDTSGNLSYTLTPTITSLVLTATVKVGSSGATLSSTTAGLVSDGGAQGQFFPNTAGNASLDGSLGTKTLGVRDTSGTSFPIVVSANPGSGHSQFIVRGQVASNGSVQLGEGFTSVRNSTGNYTISFNTAFNSAPAVVVSSITFLTSSAAFNITTTTCSFAFDNASGGAAIDTAFSFIAIGIR